MDIRRLIRKNIEDVIYNWDENQPRDESLSSCPRLEGIETWIDLTNYG